MSIIHFQTTTNSGLLLALTAGSDGATVTGYFRGNYGTLDPDVYRGVDIGRLSTASLSLSFTLNQPNLGADYFQSISIPGIGFFASADANYAPNIGGADLWQWVGISQNFVNGQDYGVTIN